MTDENEVAGVNVIGNRIVVGSPKASVDGGEGDQQNDR